MDHAPTDRTTLRFDPHTGQLYTDDGHPLKRLHCPRGVRWTHLVAGPAAGHRPCAHCDRPVHDTAGMSGAEVVQLLAQAPDACLRVEPDHPDIQLQPHGLIPATRRS